MIIGEEGAVERAVGGGAPPPAGAARGSAAASPSTRSPSRRRPASTGLRAARSDDLDRLVPACAAAHAVELGHRPARARPRRLPLAHRAQIEDGRSWVWLEDGIVLFKAEASAWTPHAVQIQQVWVDPAARGRGHGARGLRDLCRLLLETTPTVTLFVRTENTPAIALYEAIGMRKALEYRSDPLLSRRRALIPAWSCSRGSRATCAGTT